MVLNVNCISQRSFPRDFPRDFARDFSKGLSDGLLSMRLKTTARIQSVSRCVFYRKTFPTLEIEGYENCLFLNNPSRLLKLLRYLFKLAYFAFKKHFVPAGKKTCYH